MTCLDTFIFISTVMCFTSAQVKHCHSGTSRCYWMSTAGSADWSTGRTSCQSQGGDLAVIDTEELWDFVIGTFRLIVTSVQYYIKVEICMLHTAQ